MRIVIFSFSSQSSSISGAIFPYLPEPQQTCHFLPQDQQPKYSQTCTGACRTILGDSRSTEGAWALLPHVSRGWVGNAHPASQPEPGPCGARWRNGPGAGSLPCCCPFATATSHIFLFSPAQRQREARTLSAIRCVRAPPPLKKTSLRSS